MSTRYDILAERDKHSDHLSAHKCGQMSECSVRLTLWEGYMRCAAKWGTEYGDDERQRKQYFERWPDTTPSTISELRVSLARKVTVNDGAYM